MSRYNVERPSPVWRAALLGDMPPLNQLQSGFEALYRYWRRVRASRPRRTLPDKAARPHRSARLGSTISFNDDYVWAVRTAQTGVSGTAKVRSAFLDAALAYDLEQILR